MKTLTTAFGLAMLVTTGFVGAGPLDPDCTPQKAAKSAAMKATVGVGGRCSPKEAATDTAKRVTGVDDIKKDTSLPGKESKDGKSQ